MQKSSRDGNAVQFLFCKDLGHCHRMDNVWFTGEAFLFPVSPICEFEGTGYQFKVWIRDAFFYGVDELPVGSQDFEPIYAFPDHTLNKSPLGLFSTQL